MKIVAFWWTACALLFPRFLCVVHAADRVIFPNEVSPVRNDDLNFSSAEEAQCETDEGETGKCRTLQKCPELLRFIDSRNGLHTPGTSDYIKNRICKFRRRTPFVCCVTKSAPDNLILRSSRPVPSILPSKNECGFSIRKKVRGGKDFSHGAHPWLVGVGYFQVNQPFKVQCGGTLITRKHVLTAAHCFHKDWRLRPTPNNTHVILGEHSLSKDTEMKEPVILRIAERKELGYNITTRYHDISLLVLEREVRFSIFIRPACLPFGLKEEDINFIRNPFTIAGWGKTYFHAPSGTDEPLEAKVSFVSKSECRKAYSRYPEIPIDNTQICFGNDGKDACQGDSGGPLLYKNVGPYRRYFLLGIVAFGIDCGDKRYPTIYTNVLAYLEWIKKNL